MKRMLTALVVPMLLAACGEIPQDAPKPFVAENEKTSSGKALAERTDTQNEYLRIQE